MSRPTPHSARVEEAQSEAKRLVVRLIDRDGRRDDLELQTLAAINEACRMTAEADVLKRVANWVRDSGDVDTLAEQIEVSPWLLRQWREVHAPDAFSMEAA